MKSILTLVLLGLVASMIVVPAFADSKLDSFVNLATKARTQVKSQLDKMPSVSDDVKSIYTQGDSETEQLIESVKKGDATEAKKHFLAAMSAFRQITQFFSESPSPVATEASPQAIIIPKVAKAPYFDYGNALKRYETNIGILKSVAAKNNLQIDFGKFDSLFQITKTNLANGDMIALNKTFTDLKAEGVTLQNTIKGMVADKSDKRAASFANKYISKIDAILAQTKDLNLSDDQVIKLQKAREELVAGGNATQLVITIKQVYQINLDVMDAKNQKTVSQTSKQDTQKPQDQTNPPQDTKPLTPQVAEPQKSQDTQNPQTGTKDTKPQTEPIKSDQKQDRQQEKLNKQDRHKGKEQGRGQKMTSEIDKIDAQLSELEPQIDDTIKPKFDSAKAMLDKLKETGPDKKTIKAINALIEEIAQYLDSKDSPN